MLTLMLALEGLWKQQGLQVLLIWFLRGRWAGASVNLSAPTQDWDFPLL